MKARLVHEQIAKYYTVSWYPKHQDAFLAATAVLSALVENSEDSLCRDKAHRITIGTPTSVYI